MEYLFLLSGENVKLAKEEVLALIKCNYKLDDRILILKEEKNIQDVLKRLAYTKKIFSLLFYCKKSNLISNFENFDWNKIYKKDFSIRIINLADDKTESEKFFAKFVWNKVRKPRVNLENPKTSITIIFTKKNVYVGMLLKENKEKFERRKAHLRPCMLPTSMHPKLARAIVNLTGIEKGETLYDTFCGSGGILMEAGLIGCRIVGYDIYEKALKYAGKNLDYFKIKNYKLIKKDALKIKNKIDYLATDLPYGKGSIVKENLEDLYLKFLKNLKKILRKKAVVIFPDFIEYKKLIKKSKLKISNEFDYYIHKSLTKKITILN